MINSMIVSLLLTLIIEIIISYILGIRCKNDFIIIICVNIITNPIVVFTANCVRLLNNKLIYDIVVLILEIVAFFVEGFLFKEYLNYKEKKPFLISLFNNGISFLLGVVIMKFL